MLSLAPRILFSLGRTTITGALAWRTSAGNAYTLATKNNGQQLATIRI